MDINVNAYVQKDISGGKDVETTFIHFRRKPHVSVNGDCSYSQDAIVDDDGFVAQA